MKEVRIVNQSYLNFFLSVTISFSVVMYAKEEGIVGRTQKSKKGCTCHDEKPDKNVYVTILGPETLAAGQVTSYKIILEGIGSAGGVDISTSEGDLLPKYKDLKKLKGELTHSEPKKSSSGSVEFQFLYTSPNFAGEQNIFASGNMVDLNGKKTGDAWNSAVKKVFIRNSPTIN